MVNTKFCIVCRNDKENVDPKISLFQFPYFGERRKKWLNSLNLTEPVPTSARLCANHFKKEDVGCARLKRNAEPLLFSFAKKRKVRSTKHQQLVSILPKSDGLEDSAACKTFWTISTNMESQHSAVNKSNPNSNCENTNDVTVVLKDKQKSWNARQRKKRKKDAKLKMKSLLDIKKTFSSNPVFYKLIEGQVVRYKNKKKPYSEFEKTTALSIYYSCGPSGYETLLKTGFKLPTRKSLLRWMAEFRVFAGVNETLLKCLQEATSHLPLREKDCIIAWDEMSIKQWIEYNKFYDMFEGIVDYGLLGRKLESASEALVFMISSINGRWKFPISFYFSCHAMPADVLEKLVIENITAIFGIGLNIRMGICDMSFTNQKLYRLLNVTTEHPYFEINSRIVYCIHDVPHLFKLVRNNLMKHDFLFQIKMRNNVIKKRARWSHIVSFYKKDKRTLSRLAPRLTNSHIYVRDYAKMKVKLALQVLSHSVYAGMTTMCMLKILRKECLATAGFLKKMDEIFDFLNMSSINNDKQGRCAKYFFLNQDKLDNFLSFVESIEIPTMKKPDFLRGLALTIRGIRSLALDLKSEGYAYLLTRNLQQDCLENFFSAIRSKGGECRNPTARNFRCNFRFLFFTSLVHTSTSGNTELVKKQSKSKLHFNMNIAVKLKSLEVQEVSTDKIILHKTEAATFYSVKLARKLKLGDEQEACVATYVGAAAIHCFLKKKKCEGCKQLLIKKSNLSTDQLSTDYALVDVKEFDPDCAHLLYLHPSTVSFFQHINKHFPRFLTESLCENGRGVIYSIFEMCMTDSLVFQWLSSSPECFQHRKEMFLYFLRAKLYRVLRDKNDNMKQTKCWEQIRRDMRNQ